MDGHRNPRWRWSNGNKSMERWWNWNRLDTWNMNDWTGTGRRLRRRWTLTRRTSARRCLIQQLTPGIFFGRRRGTMRAVNTPTETAFTKIVERPPLLFLDTEEPFHSLGLFDNKSLGESSSDLCFIAKRTGGFTLSAWILKRSCAIWATTSPITGGKGSFTLWVHGGFMVGFE
jgi:hypothetical protein